VALPTFGNSVSLKHVMKSATRTITPEPAPASRLHGHMA
jgi:hypothetical protein